MYKLENNNNNSMIKSESGLMGSNSFSPFLMDMNTPVSLAGAALQLQQQQVDPNMSKGLSFVHTPTTSMAGGAPLSIQSSVSASSSSGASPTIVLPKISPEYLQELLKDKRNLQNFPNVFHHVDKILESEITRVRGHLFHINGTNKVHEDLPEPEGGIVTVQEKVFIPVQDNPNYNFVGRILGPRGMTAKQLETDLGCKIMIRGKGSMRDKKKEEQNRGKPNWEHLSDELHVLICVEDYQNRADVKAKRAADEIKKFLEEAVKMPDGEDELKKKQLMELAIINGTYRDTSKKGSQPSQGSSSGSEQGSVQLAQANKSAPVLQQSLALAGSVPQFLRLPGQGAAGSPIMLAGNQRLTAGGGAGGLQAQHMLSPTEHQLLNYPMVSAADYNYLLAHGLIGDPAAAAAAYTFSNTQGFEISHAGPMKARLQAATAANLRSHPYSRVPGL